MHACPGARHSMRSLMSASSYPIAGTDALRRRVMLKVAWRLIPFLGLLYFIAYLDRVNIGFAAPTMNADLGLHREHVRPGVRHCSSSATCCSRCRATSRCTASARGGGSRGSW